MTQLRRNHVRHGKGWQTSFRMIMALFIIGAVMIGAVVYFKNIIVKDPVDSLKNHADELRTFLPNSTGQIKHLTYFSLSWSEIHKKPEWVAYILTQNMTEPKNVPTEYPFTPEYVMSEHSVSLDDYAESGYLCGQLVPAGDMTFDTLGLKETFHMENISPQVKAFSDGIWKELEGQIREWVKEAETLYVITGPVFADSSIKIGRQNQITVPAAFFKVVLQYSQHEKKGIGFIIPNKQSEGSPAHYIITIDSVETVTGFDFFNDMINDEEEERIESGVDSSCWRFMGRRS
ncbi:MAG: DNA/RNA non-specific endonuclease [Saprospiraceae bacterium]|nr:DNA/RNA non-specific endonuclease [Saprospiraceae bacterium]